MLWFDYLLILLPGLMLSIWARIRVGLAHAGSARMASNRDGAETAAAVLRAGGVTGVAIEPASGELSDYYDPRGKVLRLSCGVHEGRSMTAIGRAAHEAGHAIQEAAGYPGRFVRDVVAPIAGLGSKVFWMLIAAGLLIEMFRLVVVGIYLFLTLVALQLLNVPVERDASRRGREALLSAGLVEADEEEAINRVLDAAAWAHVAEALTGAFTRPGLPAGRWDAE